VQALFVFYDLLVLRPDRSSFPAANILAQITHSHREHFLRNTNCSKFGNSNQKSTRNRAIRCGLTGFGRTGVRIALSSAIIVFFVQNVFAFTAKKSLAAKLGFHRHQQKSTDPFAGQGYLWP